MTHLSRRDFLTHSARIGGALALTQMGGFSPFAAETPPAMAIAKWAGDPIADADSTALASMAVKLTEQALDAVGGMGRFVKKGDVVWIKPNMAWTPAGTAGNINRVVATLVKFCLNAGAKTIKNGDNLRAAQKAYATSGIEAAAVTPRSSTSTKTASEMV